MKQIIEILDVISKDEKLQVLLYLTLKWRSSPIMVQSYLRELIASLWEKYDIEIEEYTCGILTNKEK